METSVNNKCKAFSSLEQSKKLAEILPIESADMCYLSDESLFPKINYNGMVFFNSEEEKPSTIIPCWSLAALLGVLPNPSLHQTKDGKWYCTAEPNRLHFSGQYNKPVDACVAMIEKLHELKML